MVIFHGYVKLPEGKMHPFNFVSVDPWFPDILGPKDRDVCEADMDDEPAFEAPGGAAAEVPQAALTQTGRRSGRTYPLVMTNIENWKMTTMLSMGRSIVSITIFHSYVTNYQTVDLQRLPELAGRLANIEVE